MPPNRVAMSVSEHNIGDTAQYAESGATAALSGTHAAPKLPRYSTAQYVVLPRTYSSPVPGGQGDRLWMLTGEDEPPRPKKDDRPNRRRWFPCATA
jgi:hypothetical protein